MSSISSKINIVFEDEFFEEPDCFGVSLVKGYKLYTHQIDAIRWMKDREKTCHRGVRGGILALTMGLGKTMTCLELCMSDINTEFPNLVVVPKTVLYEWKRDIEKFFSSSCPYLFIHPSEKGIENLTTKQLKKYKVILTTYEAVLSVSKKENISSRVIITDETDRRIGVKNRTIPTLNSTSSGCKLLFEIPWNRIIADESHRFSNPKTSTFVSMMGLYSSKKWCLSGTPIRNYSSDICSQLRFCGYDSIVNEKDFNFDIYIKHRLSECILCKNYNDAGIVLPDVIEKSISIELDGEEQLTYDYYLKKTRDEYKKFLLGNSDFSNVLTLFLRLRQCCISAYTVLPESDRKYKPDKEEKQENDDTFLNEWIRNKYGSSGILSKKITTIINIIKNIPKSEKILIFTSFKRVIDIVSLAIKTLLPGKKFLNLDGDVKGSKRDTVIDTFKDPHLDYNILIMNYKVGSEGLNLVEAKNIILCENWWTPVVQQQAKARIYRIGQDKKINIWEIIVKNSIEERIEEICLSKKTLINSFLNNDQKPDKQIKLDSYTLGRILRK